MRYAYPARFERDGEGWMVTIPGLDGTAEGPVTCGDDLEDARRMASGLVDAWIDIHLSEGRAIPVPGALPDCKGWEWVRPSMPVLFALELRELRKQAGISQAEAARRLGIKQPSYASLEDPGKANPTLKTLERLSRVFGVDLQLEFSLPAAS